MSQFLVSESDLQLEKRGLHEQLAEGFRPRPDVAPWSIALPIEWGADPFRDNNWRFHLSALRMVDPYILEFMKTKNASHLSDALIFFYDWHDYHFTRGIRHRFSWYDMSAGQRAAKLAYFLERIAQGLIEVSEVDRLKLDELATEHIRQLMVPEKIAPNNHGIFQMLGLKLLGDLTANLDASRFAEKTFKKLMSEQFTEEGLHTENSPDYHFFMQNTLRRSKVDRHLGDPLDGKEELVMAINPWLVFPNGEVARVGDSADTSAPLSKDPENSVHCRDKQYAVKDLTKSGYAIIRSMPSDEQESMMFITGMAHTIDHKHADELSFELYEGGRFLFVDSGKYGYKSGPLRQYYLSADAHNTISIAGKPIGPTDVELSGSLLKPIRYTPDAFVIEGTLNRPGLFRQNREIQYSPGRQLLITDLIEAEAEMDFVSSLHLAPDLNLHPSDEGNSPSPTFLVQVGNKVASGYMLTDGVEIEIVRGQEEPYLGWHSPGYLKSEPTTVVRAKKKGRSVKLQWRVDIVGEEAKSDLK